MKLNLTLKRLITYCLGLFIMGISVAFSVKSNLGVSPISSIPYIISLIADIDQGLCTTIIFTGFIVLQIAILRKDFQWINILQIVCSLLFGAFVTTGNMLLADLSQPDNYVIQIIYLVISMILLASGIFLYINSDIMPLPAEGIMGAIAHKTGIKFSKAKIMVDCSMVIITIIISFIYFGELKGVREGTIVAAVAVGSILGVLTELFKEKFIEIVDDSIVENKCRFTENLMKIWDCALI